MDYKWVGITAALASSVSWALGSILFKELGSKLSPFGLTLGKGFISLGLLGMAMPLVSGRPESYADVARLCLSGLIGIAVGDTLFFAALRDLSPLATVVLFVLGQVLTAVMAMIFLFELPTASAWAGILATVSGIALVLWPQLQGSTQERTNKLRGLLFGLGSVVCMSVSTVTAKSALPHTPTVAAAFVRMCAGTLGLVALALARRKWCAWLRPLTEWSTFAQTAAAVSIVTFGGFWLSMVGIKYCNVPMATTLGALEPVFVLLFGVIYLHARITVFDITGSLATVAGVVVLCSQ